MPTNHSQFYFLLPMWAFMAPGQTSIAYHCARLLELESLLPHWPCPSSVWQYTYLDLFSFQKCCKNYYTIRDTALWKYMHTHTHTHTHTLCIHIGMYEWVQLILLHLTLLHSTDTVFFTNRRSLANLHQASLSVPFFQQHLLTLCLCVTFW